MLYSYCLQDFGFINFNTEVGFPACLYVKMTIMGDGGKKKAAVEAALRLFGKEDYSSSFCDSSYSFSSLS